jgi:mycoredoxin
MRFISLCLLLASWLLSATAGMAEHVDRNGVVYFSPARSTPEVVMYSDPHCGYCRQARRYFLNNDIDYVEYNIRDSSTRMQEFRRLGGRVTPLILIGDRKIQGFNRQAIESALE